MTFPSFTRSRIQEETSKGSFERGEQYLANGAVHSIKQTADQILKGQVQGSDVHPYVVTVRFDADDIREVKCTCPFFEGSWCKHIVAVLLKTLDEDPVPAEDAVEVRELVNELDRATLISLIDRLAEHDPELIDQIKRERARLTSRP